MKLLLRAAILGLGALVVIAPAAQAQPTREEYTAQIEPICEASLPAYLDATDDGNAALKKEDTVKAGLHFARAARVFRGTFEDVRAVEPPAEDLQLISAWVALELRDARTLNRYATALIKGREHSAAHSLQTIDTIDDLIGDLIGGYELRFCA
jgi:hypothetical protein